MGKMYLGDIEVTNYDAVMSLSSTTTAHTANTEIHVTQALLDRISTLEEKIQKAQARETSVYEIIGEPEIPTEIEGDATSFDIIVDYKRTDTHSDWSETVTEGTDTITVECGANPSTSSTRTVSGTVDYYGNEIEYSVTQSKLEVKITAKFNVTSTSNPTKIASDTTNFSKIEIDGVEETVSTGYTFETASEHTVKYTLTDPTSIGERAFYKCISLTSIDIPNSVTSIGDSTFYNCSGLTTCTIGSGVTSIGDNAFYQCSGLTSIDIPDSVTSIGVTAFAICSGLTSCTIGNGVTNIRAAAFSNCRGLTSIEIPSDVTSIGNNAFVYCTNLTSVTVRSVTPPSFVYASGYTYPPFDNTNNCPIYVPSGSVDAYKAASGWSNYASRIQAIP